MKLEDAGNEEFSGLFGVDGGAAKDEVAHLMEAIDNKHDTPTLHHVKSLFGISRQLTLPSPREHAHSICTTE